MTDKTLDKDIINSAEFLNCMIGLKVTAIFPDWADLA